MIDNDIQALSKDKQLRAVLIVLNSFNPDGRVLKEAISLTKVGMFVSVCAMHEPGLAEQEHRQDLDIQRIRLKTRSLPKIRLIQFFKYLEFIFKSVSRFKSYDIVHCNDLNALPIGVLIKLLNRKVRLLYDAHEYEIHVSAKQGPASIKMNYYLERFLIKFTDAVIVTSLADAIEYEKMYNIAQPRVVMNCPISTPPVVDRSSFIRKFNIPPEQIIYLYQGALTEARGIQVMLEAFSRIHDNSSCIVFMGSGAMKSTIEKYTSNHAAIHFHDAVPFDELYKYTACADCGVIFMANTCANHNFALPNKLFEYVMAEIPTLTTPLQEITRVVNEYNLGFVAKGEDADSLYELVRSIDKKDIRSLHPDLRASRDLFTWKNQEKILLSAYHDMLIP